jgi:ribosome maturation factor RimP
MSRALHTKLIQIVEPAVEAAGFELADLRFVLEQGGWTLRVLISLPLVEGQDISALGPDQVDIADCEQISRELSAVLDVEDPIPQAYSLEVSSPGIDRPLRTAAHFTHFKGSEAKIQLAVPVHTESGERRNFKGKLKGVIDDKVEIDVDGHTFQLAIADIDSAKLVPDWDAVMHGKSGVGTPSQPTKDFSPKRHKQKH